MTPPDMPVLSRERIEENETVHPDLLGTFNNMHRQLENLQEELGPLVFDYEEKQKAAEKANQEERWAHSKKWAKEKAIAHLRGQIEEMRGTKDSLA